MSWVFMVLIAILLLAVLLIEFRAIREGDEREHHAPGYALVMGGVVMIGIGIAGAMSDQAAMALLASAAGLILVVLGATLLVVCRRCPAHGHSGRARGPLGARPASSGTTHILRPRR